MTSGIGGLGSYSSAQFQSLFSKIDTDSSGTVTRDEFIAGAPDDVSADNAGSLYDKLDSEGTGALTASDMMSAFQQMASSMQSSMIQAQSNSSTDSTDSDRPDASDLFAKLDADGDGSVSREEFVSGRPDDVSEEQASALFDKVAGSTDATSVDEETFVAAMQPPAGGGGGGGAAASSDDEETYDALDTNKDGVVSREEFLAGRPDDVSEEQATNLFNSLAGDDAESITPEQLAAGMQGPPPPSESDTESSASSTALSADDQKLIDKLMAALEEQSGTSTSSDSSSSSGSALQQLLSAIDAYTKSQSSSLYSSNTTTSLLLNA